MATTLIEIESVLADMMIPAQAAALAKCSRDQVMTAIENGRLQGYAIRPKNGARATARRNRWLRRGDVKTWIADGTPTRPVPAPAPEPAPAQVAQQLALAPVSDPQLQQVLQELADLRKALEPLQQLQVDLARLVQALT